MIYIYPFIIAFTLIFISELGDKTQLLTLSFASKLKTHTILIGVALGSFFSHGIAILFGSFLGNIEISIFQYSLKAITYLSFVLFGILNLYSKEKNNCKKGKSKTLKSNFNYMLFITFSIAIGELGDKTFLSSIGLRYTISFL